MLSAMFAPIRQAVRRKADKWLFQLRDAEPGEVFLHRRRVFILPTGAGVGFGVLLVVLLVGATNYNLSLGFALVFALGACASVDMYLTYKNLGQLHLRPGRAQPLFAGEDAQFELTLVNRTRLDRYALWVDFVRPGQARYVADVQAGSDAALLLSAPSVARGALRRSAAVSAETVRVNVSVRSRRCCR